MDELNPGSLQVWQIGCFRSVICGCPDLVVLRHVLAQTDSNEIALYRN
jgi:hypothetical protein